MSTDYVDMHLESEDFSCDQIQIHTLRGKETISQLFSFDLEIVCLDPAGLDAEKVAGSTASIVLHRSGKEVRRIHGMVEAFEECLDVKPELQDRASAQGGSQLDSHTYRMRLVPRAHRLRLVQTQEIFLDMTVPQIIEEKLKQVQLSGEDYEFRLREEYPVRELTAQYKETDLAFISRLAEHLGISFFFEHDSGVDKLVFSDTQEIFPELPSALLRHRGDRRDVFGLDLKTKVLPAMYVVQDYNYRTPHVDLNSKAEIPAGFGGGIVEHGGHFKTPSEGDRLARIRAEEQQVERRVYTGESDLAAWTAGRRVALEGPRPANLLVVEVEHEANRAVLTHGGDGSERHYVNKFRAIPAEHTYRPPRITPRPRIHGVVTGIIEHGIELGIKRWAELEDWGRYTVRILFDTAEHEAKQSRQIRMIQPHVGTNYGIHFPLKPGMEVLLTFVDGDPDRPLIVGGVYRPDTPSPVNVVNSTINKIKSESGVIIEIHDA